MNAISGKLRQAREASGITLDSIAIATRIQKKFLEAMEEGNFSILPQTYVRAFLRAYAREVGLIDTQILQEYDALKSEEEHAVVETPLPSGEEVKLHINASAGRSSQKNLLFLLALALIGGLVLSVYIFQSDRSTPEVKEIPFQEVVRQAESPKNPSEKKDSTSSAHVADSASLAAAVRPIPQQQIKTESLSLRVITFDSVRIRIVIDGKLRKEYHAPPQWTGRWKAADHFILSVSNPAAASFTLDNVPLSSLSRSNRPINNMRIPISQRQSQGPTVIGPP